MTRQQLLQVNQKRANGERTLKQNTVKLNEHREIQENDDSWVIPLSVITAEGVHNGGLKRAQEIAATWRLAAGIPFVHGHPPDVVVLDMELVGGWTENVGFDAETGQVTTDLVLLKQPIDGLQITDTNVRRNEELVEAFQEDKELHLSIGYWSTDDFLPGEHNGEPYEWIERTIVYNHVAHVHRGACSWEDGCGLGRGQPGQNTTMENKTMTNEGKQNNQGEDPCTCKTKGAGNGSDPGSGAEGKQDSPAPESPGVAANQALRTELDKEQARNNALDERLKALEKAENDRTEARLNEKRANLAKLLDGKPEDLPTMNEEALDFAIKRESEFRGNSDTTPLGGGAGGSPDGAPQVEGGIADTGHGYTVMDWDAVGKPTQNGKTPAEGEGGEAS